MTTSFIVRAGRAVEERRAQLGMSRATLARAAGLDIKTVTAVENATSTPSPLTRAAIERAIEWPVGTYNQIAAGIPFISVDTTDADVAARAKAMRLAVDWTAHDQGGTTTELIDVAAVIEHWIRTGTNLMQLPRVAGDDD